MTTSPRNRCWHAAPRTRRFDRDEPTANGVRVENLRILFGAQVALDGVTVNVPARRLTAAVGPPGSGKTVLLKALSCELPWGAGTIWIQEVPARLWPGKKLEAFVATCPAADGRLSEEGLTRSLSLLGLEHLRNRPTATMAERDRRRYELAATLAGLMTAAGQQSVHLWLDDPLDGLDTLHQHQLLQWLRDTAAARHTTVITASDHALVSHYAEHAILLSGGCVVSEGPPYAAFQSRELTRAFRIG